MTAPSAQRRLLVLVVSVAALGAALVAGAGAQVVRHEGALGGSLLLVCVVSLLTDLTATDVRIGRQVESYTWAELSVVLGLALLPDEQLLLTAALVALSYHGGGVRGLKLAMNAGCYAVGLGLAVLVVHLLQDPTWQHPFASGLTLATAAGVFALWNKVAVDAAIALSLGLRLREVMRPGWNMALLVFFGNVGLAFATLGLTHVHRAFVLVAPVGVLLVFTARGWYLRVIQDREVWTHLEAAGRELAALDEATLAEAGLRRVAALLKADGARLRLHRDGFDTVYTLDADVMVAPQSEVAAACDAVRSSALHTTDAEGVEQVVTTVLAPVVSGDLAVGALEVRFHASVGLSSRETGVLSAYAGTLAIALANARLHAQVQEQSEHYARAALTDSLTGLANRARLQERADPEWLAAGDRARLQERADPEWLAAGDRALLLLDLDGFKAVNDTHGHAVGDQLLQVVSQRLVGAVRPQDLVCRLGGDEFAVLLAEDAGISACVTRIRTALANPVDIEGRRLRIGTSIGAASTAVEGADLDALLRTADSRMYVDKADRRTPSPRPASDDPQVVVSESAPERREVRQVIQLGRTDSGARRRG